MSYNLYYHRFREILNKSMTIDNLLDRLKYLRRERAWFLSQNVNSDVPRIVVLYDFAIQETEDLIKFEINKPEATEVKNAKNIEPTIETKIRQALDPLKNVFDNTDHIDKIIHALIEYSDSHTLPDKEDRKVFHCPNNEFYPAFKKIAQNSNFSVSEIANILAYFIYQNRTSLKELESDSIRRNIYRYK
ncbi:MAG TPA: hypothetical protein VK172_09265 [Lentimicrobium sp.]|nr:hypothetical protein [Lentimicrobium sp.]